MATSGRGSGVVGYNVQTAVDTENHLIIAHEVTTSGSDRSQLANMAQQAKAVRSYWTSTCKACPLKSKCTTGPERRIKRWEHEHVVEAVQARLDKNPNAMRTRRETVEHPFGTLKMRMGATHFLCTTLPKVATEIALCVLGYNLTRVLNIVGMKPLLAAVRG